MTLEIVIFCCQDILCGQNRTQYQRAHRLTSEYETVILSRGAVCETIETRASETRRAPVHFLTRLVYPLWLLLQIVSLRRNHDISHVHTTHSPQTLLAGVLAQLCGCVWIADIWDDPALGMDIEGKPSHPVRYAHRLYNQTLLRLVRLRLSQADLIIVALVPSILEAYGVDPDSENVLSVTNGVNVSETRAIAARMRSEMGPTEGSDTTAFRLLYLGPVRRVRGLETLLDALAETKTSRQIEVRLVGNVREQDREWFDRYRATNEMEHVSIALVGEVPHDRALWEVDAADACLCLLSPDVRNYQYAYPIKLFEYMALGKAIVCTRMGGTEHIIEDGTTGLLVPPADASAVARALESLASSPELRQRLGAAARAESEQYDWDNINRHIQARIDAALS